MTSPQNITAIIYDKRGRILSIGKNSYRDSSKLQRKHAYKVGLPDKLYNHAEVSAIIRCRDLTKAHTIRILRVNSQGKYLKAAPCKICQSAIEAAGIPNVEHS